MIYRQINVNLRSIGQPISSRHSGKLLYLAENTRMIAEKYLKVALLLTATLLLAECKKGENDPALSLRTRKARLAGDWRLKEGRASITYYTTSSVFNESYMFDGSQLKLNTDEPGVPVTYVAPYVLGLTINKDGSFSCSELLGNKSLNGEGSWNFNSGVGERKSKEYVIFTINKVSGSKTTGYHLFNRTGTEFEYAITELRSDRLVIHSAGKVYLDEDDRYIDFSTDYTFEQ
jgi:hypothetical protein